MVFRLRLGIVIPVLLACNTAYYAVAGRFSEALESLAWYALLILFTLETARGPLKHGVRILALMHGVRVLAALAIVTSAGLYVREKEWLDAANLFLWLAVVGLLEVEVRRPAMVARQRKVFVLTATALYSGLALMVVIWLVRGEWMNAWDAALWFAAFGLLEINVLGKNQYIKNIL